LISLSNEVKKAQLFLCFMKLQRYEDEWVDEHSATRS
jgi:hypothetical protein